MCKLSYAVSLFSVMVSVATWAGEAKPPNIVILYADDMGYGDLSVQNADSKIATPHLDELATEGMRFTDAHSSSGICTPSRYALLTGRYHWRKFHDIVHTFGGSVLDSERITLPEMLQQQGYRTACIGKWHLGWDWDAIKRPGARPRNGSKGVSPHYAAGAFDWTKPVPGGPLDHGFDYYFGDDVPNFPPYAWIENDRLLAIPTVPVKVDPVPQEGRAECRPGPSVEGWRLDEVMPRITERAVEWVGEQAESEQPFFLYFPWTAPHAPIVPTEQFQHQSGAGPYGDYVQQCDWTAGQVLDALDQHGLTDNTIVIFTSDNGPEGYAYARVNDTGHRSMGPLRGVKRDIWEGGHRVPMIVRWPGVVEPGTVSDALMSQIDIYATLAAVVGAEIPPGMAEDSIDQRAVLRGEPAVREALVHNTHAEQYSIRRGDWVLVDTDKAGYNRGRVPDDYVGPADYEAHPEPAALYNLADDLGERQNVIESHGEVAEDLRELLHRIRSGATK